MHRDARSQVRLPAHLAWQVVAPHDRALLRTLEDEGQRLLFLESARLRVQRLRDGLKFTISLDRHQVLAFSQGALKQGSWTAGAEAKPRSCGPTRPLRTDIQEAS